MLGALDNTSGGLGTLDGRVTYHSSAPLSRANVKSQDSSAQEGGDGQYKVIYLTPGRYTVKEMDPPGCLMYANSLIPDVTFSPEKNRWKL